MCFGALIQARVSRVVFGAQDTKVRASHLVDSIHNANHRLICEGGLLDEVCREQLQSFFRMRR